jgi:hypothetical protein
VKQIHFIHSARYRAIDSARAEQTSDYGPYKIRIISGPIGWGIRYPSKSGPKSINRFLDALRGICPIPPASGLRASLAEHMYI